MKTSKNTPDTDKKLAIIDAALQLITENGFHNAPMSVIAKRAGVAAGTIYHHFSGKDEIINALYSFGKENMGKAMLAADDPGLNFRKRFESVWQSLFRHFIKHPAEFLFLEQYANSPFISQVTKEENQRFYQSAIDLCASGMKAGKLRKMDIELMVNLVYGDVATCVKLHLSGELKMTPARIAQAIESSWDSIRK